MSEKTKIEKAKELLVKLDNKDFGIYFFTLDTKGTPSAGIANIYEHVKVLTELGYNAHILHEKNDYQLKGDVDKSGLVDWLGEEYGELSHVSIESQELNVGPQDVIVIPEVFSNVMDQVKTFPCKKVVLSQSYDYLLELLPIGRKWTDYGFEDVITTSEKQAKYLKSLFPNIRTSIIPVGIPEYFKKSDKPKIPVVTILTREQSDAVRIAKKFYLQYPMYKWLTFKELRGLSREDFAKELGKSCLSVWIDESAGFGTLPIEAIECDTPVIAKIPNMVPEWMESVDAEGNSELLNNGIWTSNVMNIPDLIATYMNLWLEDSVPEDILSDMDKVKGRYSMTKQKEAIAKVYGEIINNRKLEIEGLIQDAEKEETNK